MRLKTFGKIKGIVIWLFLLAYSSCKDGSCPLSAGAGSSETRDLPAFSEIVLYDKINLILTQDSIQRVSLGGGANLLKGIQTTVQNGILTVQNNNHCNWLRNPDYQIDLNISTNQLEKITYYGAGNISSTNTLVATQFTMDSWEGTGSISLSLIANQVSAFVRNNNARIMLSGTSDSTYIYCGQEGSVNAIDLSSDYVSVDSKSIEDIYVKVSGGLHADVVYKGNVYYLGNPSSIDSLVTNSGRLIHLQ
jgi:hypothetical protein